VRKEKEKKRRRKKGKENLKIVCFFLCTNFKRQKSILGIGRGCKE
jgi:hypothetical protein